MTTAAIAAFGVTLKRDGNVIAEVTNIGGMEITREMLDVTNEASASTYREFIPGMKEAAELTIQGNFKAGDTDGQVGLVTDLEAGTLQDFILTFPTSITATWTFKAYVTKFKTGDFPVAGKLDFSASLKITGKPVVTTARSMVRALQEYYARHPDSRVNLRELHDALDEKFHRQGGRKYLFGLLPGGPVAQGCRLAGLQPPARAVQSGFGSVA